MPLAVDHRRPRRRRRRQRRQKSSRQLAAPMVAPTASQQRVPLNPPVSTSRKSRTSLRSPWSRRKIAADSCDGGETLACSGGVAHTLA